MDIPEPFQSVFAKWQACGITMIDANWTSNQKRHVGAKMKMPDGQLGFAKLAISDQQDQDENDMVSGMQREVWWSKLIQALHQYRPDFPFTSPKVLRTNVESLISEDDVAWIIFEYIHGRPIIDWDITAQPKMTNELGRKFVWFTDKTVECLLALNTITRDVLQDIEMYDVPSLPHGSRRWLKRGLMDLNTAVLGNGAFEVANIWETDDGQTVIMDNEFAGWYPRYDSLSYLYHRIYCNAMRPDLACYLCCRYMDKNTGIWVDDFLADFSRTLQPRLMSGWYYDIAYRWIPPWHKKHRLRYWLYWHLKRKHWNALWDKDFR